jgi:ribulose-phosphate 3-epimerase
LLKKKLEVVDMSEITPSLFNANIMNIEEDIRFFEENEVNILHVDMMDGNFVPNIAFGPDQIKQIKQHTTMKLDVHLMVQNPENIVDKVIDAGADLISVHYESTCHIHEVIKRIRSRGVKAGIAINPGTPLTGLKYLLDSIDYILIMSINPGQFSQEFIETTFAKIEDTKELIGDRNIFIEVDGRINPDIAERCVKVGAALLVVGTNLFSGDKELNLRQLREYISKEA